MFAKTLYVWMRIGTPVTRLPPKSTRLPQRLWNRRLELLRQQRRQVRQ